MPLRSDASSGTVSWSAVSADEQAVGDFATTACKVELSWGDWDEEVGKLKKVNKSWERSELSPASKPTSRSGIADEYSLQHGHGLDVWSSLLDPAALHKGTTLSSQSRSGHVSPSLLTW